MNPVVPLSPKDKIWDLSRMTGELLFIYYRLSKEYIYINIGDVRVDRELLIKGYKI